MDEKCKNAFSLILALTALAASALPFIIPEMDSLEKIWEAPIYLFFWGWFPVLALIIISFLVSRRLESRPLKHVILLILTVSAILALFWAMFSLAVLIDDVAGL